MENEKNRICGATTIYKDTLEILRMRKQRTGVPIAKQIADAIEGTARENQQVG